MELRDTFTAAVRRLRSSDECMLRSGFEPESLACFTAKVRKANMIGRTTLPELKYTKVLLNNAKHGVFSQRLLTTIRVIKYICFLILLIEIAFEHAKDFDLL